MEMINSLVLELSKRGIIVTFVDNQKDGIEIGELKNNKINRLDRKPAINPVLRR